MLASYDLQPSNWALEMATLAEKASQGEWNKLADDLSERSREILDGEFVDDLITRMQSDP